MQHCLFFKLYILSILPFKSGRLVSLLLRITAVQTSLVAATECEFIHGRPARYYWHARKLLRSCDKRTCINTCVNKSLVQTLESCPLSDASACCSANLVPFLMKIRSHAGLLNAYMPWTAKNWMHYSASHVATTAVLLCPKMASEAISEHLIFKKFL